MAISLVAKLSVMRQNSVIRWQHGMMNWRKKMKVKFSTADEFLNELTKECEAPPAPMPLTIRSCV